MPLLQEASLANFLSAAAIACFSLEFIHGFFTTNQVINSKSDFSFT